MSKWDQLATDATIQKTIKTLKANGIEAEVVNTSKDAKDRILEIIPKSAEVMTMSSVTLESIGITEEINESGRYKSVKKMLFSMNLKTQGFKMQRLGAAPEWAIGSVHAATQDGKLLIASNTGSQLGAYAYASAHVIWVIGTQKIVKDTDEGVKRIYNYVLPLEDKHMRKLYGMGSNVSKLLIINKEISPQRLHVIFVKEKLGY